MKKIILKIILIIAVIAPISPFPFFSFDIISASTINFEPRYPWQEEGVETPTELIRVIYIYALGIVSVVALMVMIYGGILYTASAGNTSKQQEAKNWITGAVLGLALLLGAYLILWTINPDLVRLRDAHFPELDEFEVRGPDGHIPYRGEGGGIMPEERLTPVPGTGIPFNQNPHQAQQ